MAGSGVPKRKLGNHSKRRYYLGRDPANPKRVIRIYPTTGTVPPNPYVYQPGSESWTGLYQWGIIRPYIFPHK